MESLVKSVCGVSKYLSKYVFDKIEKKGNKVTQPAFLSYFNTEIAKYEPKKRMFKLIAKYNKPYIAGEDFKAFLRCLIDKHPGLLFFKPSTEFHEKYSILVTSIYCN